jgi:hypothetical protein
MKKLIQLLNPWARGDKPMPRSPVSPDSTGLSGDPTSPDDAHHWISSLQHSASFANSEQILATATWQRIVQARYADTADMPTSWPLPLLAAVRVGAQLWASRSLPRGKPLRITAGPLLVATMDIHRHEVALRTDLRREDLDNLSTAIAAQGEMVRPAGSTTTTMCDLLWQYALHDPTALMVLPPEVAYKSMELRKMPLVSSELMQPRHTQLMRILLKKPLTFEQMLEQTEIPAHQLCHDIAALIMTRALYPVQKATAPKPAAGG